MTQEEYIKMWQDYYEWEKKEKKRIKRKINRVLLWAKFKRLYNKPLQ